MKTVIIDYGSGNLHSALKCFQKVANLNKKGDVLLTSDAQIVRSADKIVLPGVGSFNDCLNGIKSNKDLFFCLSDRVLKQGVPFLGICVGLQLLADYGHENVKNTQGLGWISGDVTRIIPKDVTIKIPHMGWNSMIFDREHLLTKNLTKDDAKDIANGNIAAGNYQLYRKSHGVVTVPLCGKASVATRNRLQKIIELIFEDGLPAHSFAY